MNIYDISQEVFGCEVFPGDPSPAKTDILKIKDGDICNLSELKMCAHNGTHIDAPRHFIDDGKTVDEVEMRRFVGYAYVASHEGNITGNDAEKILEDAVAASESLTDCDCHNRILVKGNATMTEEAAGVFADKKILLYGNESQTVGPVEAPETIHKIMLGEEIVLLEGIRLNGVEDGVYILNAAPLNLGGAEGAPCRAILISV